MIFSLKNAILNKYARYTNVQRHSSEKKHYIETLIGKKLLLRVSDISEYDKRKKQFEMLKDIAIFDINMTKPVDFGVCNNGKSVYMLLSCGEGESLHTKLSSLAIEEQYRFGVIAGEILMKIHSLPVRDNIECSVELYNQGGQKIFYSFLLGFGSLNCIISKRWYLY